ncbi:hypothetical protein ACI6QG_07965 [Roseococcus sp. DSY-14]|uniref:hypothetical protein n=1 Tax=Roseococcus sp. DSY-14 TaxID=3369650 RepID=UPI00387B0301
MVNWDALTPILAGTGVLLASFVTLAVTVFSLRRNHRKDVSLRLAEHRLRRMDELAAEMANYLGAVARLSMRGKASERAVQEYARAATKVQLLLNHEDQEYARLDALMEEVDLLLADAKRGGTEPPSAEVERLDDAFVAIADRVMQREWTRTQEALRADTGDARALSALSGRKRAR